MRFASIALITLSLLGASAGRAEEPAPMAEKGGEKIPNWTYIGENDGPEHWGDLSKDTALCHTGHRQSPIDIPGKARASDSHIVFDYHAANASIVNTGHTVEVTPKGAGGLIIDGARYTLKRFEFHTPSEHAINGHRAQAEVEFVHIGPGGAMLILSVMIETGDSDPYYGAIWRALPTEPDDPRPIRDTLINPRDLMPSAPAAYAYAGSVTHPPCTEGVAWVVFKSPKTLSKEDSAALEKILGPSARPLQELSGRDLFSVGR